MNSNPLFKGGNLYLPWHSPEIYVFSSQTAPQKQAHLCFLVYIIIVYSFGDSHFNGTWIPGTVGIVSVTALTISRT